MHISDFLIRTTIRIETVASNGSGTGTGFFYSFGFNKDNNSYIPVIVTNKHVIEGAVTGKLLFSLQDANGDLIKGSFHNLVINDFEKLWIPHPEKDIDLCVLPIASIHREIQNSRQDLFYTCLRNEMIPSSEELEKDFSKVEDITVVGYPDGIWDSFNNTPITRRGITATPLQYNFENTPRFLIDASIYGGSSGSPVFIFNQGSFSLINRGLFAGDRLKFIGIVYAVAQHTITGELKIVNVPAINKPILESQMPNNLGVVIKAEKLQDFEAILNPNALQ